MKKILLILMVVLTSTTVCAENYISDVMVIGGSKSEVNTLKNTYANQGWTVINQDLNAGCGSGSDYIYLLYKTASETTVGANFISDFVIVANPGYVPNKITFENRSYKLVNYDGGDDFKESKGDLNCHAGGKYIHLYYTTIQSDERCRAVKTITFNNKQEAAVGDTAQVHTGYDLNSSAGGSFIYMHITHTQGWTAFQSIDGNDCYIYGFEGPRQSITSLIIPSTLYNATVHGFNNFDFTQFPNLETVNFLKNSVMDSLPKIQNCIKLKHINTIDDGWFVYDITPPALKRIQKFAFVGTAIEKITLDGVEKIEQSAFEGCSKLSEVKMNQTATIENLAFANIAQKCNIIYAGSSGDWNPAMFKFSPKLAVYAVSDAKYMGWCGATDNTGHNTLYWTMDNNKHLNIDSYDLMWNNYPAEQLIAGQGWTTRESTTAVKDIRQLSLEHVDTIASSVFKDYKSLDLVDIKSGTRIIGNSAFEGCESLAKVYLPSSLTTIRKNTFKNCAKLADVYFDGPLMQWNNGVAKEENWNSGRSENYTEHWRCTVTFECEGLTQLPDPQRNLWSNESKVQKPIVHSTSDYVLAGWYKDAELTKPWDFDNDIVPGDMTLYGKWSEFINGDINCDGRVDISDVNIIINIMLGIVDKSSYPGNSDFDYDNNIDISDLNFILNIMMRRS